MPPKFKFTKEAIVDCAFNIVRENGIEELTARALASSLGTSTKVIFGQFEGMGELTESVITKARELYYFYVLEGFKDEIKFRGLGVQYVEFARCEPKLFKLLFMNKDTKGTHYEKVRPTISENFDEILASMETDFSVDRELAKKLFNHLFIYTHGIATMCADGVCDLNREEIEGRVNEVFTALYNSLKGE